MDYTSNAKRAAADERAQAKRLAVNKGDEDDAKDALRQIADAQIRKQRQKPATEMRNMERNAVLPSDDAYEASANEHNPMVAMRKNAMANAMRASLEAQEPMEVPRPHQKLVCVSSDIEGGPLALQLTTKMRSKALDYADLNILQMGYVHCGDAGDIRGESMQAINFLNMPHVYQD